MKKVPLKKLALTAETIRSLTPAQLGTVAGGVIVVVNTTHSIITVCGTVTGTVTTTVSSETIGGSIAQ